ncbi:hypothetical protein [Xanthomonas sp. 3307]|uniref:hypothetical protein n=1 Tax=Xanthomonas sp. 3307 TaxID=3035316 RepID=UPI0016163777|nr:hypothetical protein [Xanthomonas sp. 3307]MBB5941337.1 hypothetical protein [Xanthomonas sp. 3307]
MPIAHWRGCAPVPPAAGPIGLDVTARSLAGSMPVEFEANAGAPAVSARDAKVQACVRPWHALGEKLLHCKIKAVKKA